MAIHNNNVKEHSLGSREGASEVKGDPATPEPTIVECKVVRLVAEHKAVIPPEKGEETIKSCVRNARLTGALRGSLFFHFHYRHRSLL